MSRIGLIWRGFSRINNAGVSVHGVLFIAIAGALGTLLGRSAVMPLVESSSMALGATFLVVCLSAIHSRRKYPDLKRPYKMKFGLLLPLLGVGAAVSTLILAGSGLYSPDTAVPLELLLFLGLLLLGLGLWFLSTSSRRSHTVQELRVLIAEDR
jgi:amino acid transporter